MRISEVAIAAGVNVETVRFYERKGLIDQPSRPAEGGYRSYSPETVDRIRFIRQTQNLTFSLREIGELLSLRADPEAECAAVRNRFQAKLEEVKIRTSDLDTTRSILEKLINACTGEGAPARSCAIFGALEAEGIERLSPPQIKKTER